MWHLRCVALGMDGCMQDPCVCVHPCAYTNKTQGRRKERGQQQTGPACMWKRLYVKGLLQGGERDCCSKGTGTVAVGRRL